MCARVNKESIEKSKEAAPGSGKVWKNEITVPKPPKITANVSQRQKYARPLNNEN